MVEASSRSTWTRSRGRRLTLTTASSTSPLTSCCIPTQPQLSRAASIWRCLRWPTARRRPLHGAQIIRYPARTSFPTAPQFLGRVLGKALYESILVEPQFAHFFLNKLLGRHNYIDDLYTLDPEVRFAPRLRECCEY